MTVKCSIVAATMLAFAGPAIAADLSVQITAPGGAPIRDAVITVHRIGAATPAVHAAGAYAVDQQNIQFHPFVLIVPAGARVSFLNHDEVRHQVYSFSPAKTFELKLEKRQQDRAVLFDKPGIVPLGCNIHDRMIAFVDVVDTPWAAKTDAAGKATLHDLPAGPVQVDVWHPYLRAAGNRLSRSVVLTDGTTQHEAFTGALRSPPQPPAQSDY